MAICPSCHKEIVDDASFCAHCGFSLSGALAPAMVSQTRLGPFLKNDIMTFVGKNNTRYWEQFINLEQKRLTFHWPAFFTYIGWMSYRKMYKEAAIAFIAINCISRFSATLCTRLFYDSSLLGVSLFGLGIEFFISIGIMVGCALLANPLYAYHVKKKLREMGCENREPIENQNLSYALQSEGGTSVAAVWISFGIVFVISFIEQWLLYTW